MKNGYFVLVAEIMTAAYTPRPERHLYNSLFIVSGIVSLLSIFSACRSQPEGITLILSKYVKE